MVYICFVLLLFPATYDVKKIIGDIAVNVHGSQIAIVENQGGYESVEESAVRIYNVGRKRNEDNNAVNFGILIERGEKRDRLFIPLFLVLSLLLQEEEEEEDEDSEEDDSDDDSLGSQSDFNTMEGTDNEAGSENDDEDGDALQNIIRSLLQRN